MNTIPFPVQRPVNVLAPYVITGRLLDLVSKAPGGGRIVNVASLSASYSLDFDNLQVGRLTAFRPAHFAFERNLGGMVGGGVLELEEIECLRLDPSGGAGGSGQWKDTCGDPFS